VKGEIRAGLLPPAARARVVAFGQFRKSPEGGAMRTEFKKTHWALTFCISGLVLAAPANPQDDQEDVEKTQNQPAGSPGFFAGNCEFITRKLWGFYNQGGAFMHHGKFTTAREAVEAQHGEGLSSRQSFDALSKDQQNGVIEFLKSLQVLPPGTKSLVVDERGHPKAWLRTVGALADRDWARDPLEQRSRGFCGL
jgi:hypothetical protein